MTTERLDQAINMIRPELIEEASMEEPVPQKKSYFLLKFAAAAAVLLLCVGGSIYALPRITGRNPSPLPVPESTGISAGGSVDPAKIGTGNGNISLTTVMEAEDGMAPVKIKETEAEKLTGLLRSLKAIDAENRPKEHSDSEEGYLILFEEGDSLILFENGDVLDGEQWYLDPEDPTALYREVREILSQYYRK